MASERRPNDPHENVRENLRRWDEVHTWPQNGDEWSGQAAVCGVPYDAWKKSLVRHLIVPYVGAQATVLEIAPGHGRWTEHLARHAGHVIAVDLSPACLAHCRSRFDDRITRLARRSDQGRPCRGPSRSPFCSCSPARRSRARRDGCSNGGWSLAPLASFGGGDAGAVVGWSVATRGARVLAGAVGADGAVRVYRRARD